MVKNKQNSDFRDKIIPITPTESKIFGVEILERKIFYDERGFLIETFSQSKEKDKSIYSYTSFTQPGFARDEDRFHLHLNQKDRFTVVLGRMWILLYDHRNNSPTYGRLEVIEAKGGDPKIREKIIFPVFTISIPEGVYHGIKNPGSKWAMLVNHPTAEYNPDDEGRVLFAEVPIPSMNGKTFSWDKITNK